MNQYKFSYFLSKEEIESPIVQDIHNSHKEGILTANEANGILIDQSSIYLISETEEDDGNFKRFVYGCSGREVINL